MLEMSLFNKKALTDVVSCVLAGSLGISGFSTCQLDPSRDDHSLVRHPCIPTQAAKLAYIEFCQRRLWFLCT